MTEINLIAGSTKRNAANAVMMSLVNKFYLIFPFISRLFH